MKFVLPFAAALLPATLATAQDAPATPLTPATPAMPAAGSPEAAAMLEQAINKMAAYGRGTFRSSEKHDSAMTRKLNLPFGDHDTEVKGGWTMDLVWGESDGDHYVRHLGRMLAKVDGSWRLRGNKLASGHPAPFTVEPSLLFSVLGQMPAGVCKVANVEAGEVGGKACAILSVELSGDAATELVDTGVLPEVGGGGGMFLIGGPDMPAPELQHTVYLAFFVDVARGDLLRLGAKVYEKNEMMGNVQIQVAGGAGGDEEGDDEEEEKTESGPMTWKKGFPKKKPAKDESVLTWRVDFSDLGRADAPELDERTKQLLRLR